MSSTPRQVLVFGAGGIGLCFVTQLFARSGYQVTVADVDARTIQRIRDGNGYVIDAYDPAGHLVEHRITGIQTADAADADTIRAILSSGAEPPIIATAVGQRAFEIVLRNLNDWAPRNRPLSVFDLIAAENIHDARAYAVGILGSDAPSVHACAVGKMVPRRTQAELENDELPMHIRCEAFNTLYVDGANWRTTLPSDVNDLELVDPIEAWMDRKLYVHNLGHSACAWIARDRDPSVSTIAEAILMPDVRDRVQQVMAAAADVVRLRWPDQFAAGDMSDHVEDLVARFGSTLLRDTVERVGQDVRRKLGRSDRLVGCMLLAAELAPQTLGTFADLWHAAVRFGVAGISENSDDVAVAALPDPDPGSLSNLNQDGESDARGRRGGLDASVLAAISSAAR